MHGTASLLISAALPVCLAAVIGWLNDLRIRRNSDKEQGRVRAEGLEGIDVIQKLVAACDQFSSSDNALEETKLKARDYLIQIFSRIEDSLVPRPAERRPTLRQLATRQLATAMLQKRRPKTRVGKALLIFYRFSLFWALLLTALATDLAFSQAPSFENILAIIMVILILGVLPAWGCRVLAIHVDERRAKLKDLHQRLADTESANADSAAIGEVLVPHSSAQPTPIVNGSPTSATSGIAVPPSRSLASASGNPVSQPAVPSPAEFAPPQPVGHHRLLDASGITRATGAATPARRCRDGQLGPAGEPTGPS
jgi:hypothetical protein